MKLTANKHKYSLVTFNGRVKISIDDNLFLAFNQIDFKGLYAYKDDTNLYGIDIYLMSSDSQANHTLEIYFKTKEVWLAILKLINDRL